MAKLVLVIILEERNIWNRVAKFTHPYKLYVNTY